MPVSSRWGSSALHGRNAHRFDAEGRLRAVVATALHACAAARSAAARHDAPCGGWSRTVSPDAVIHIAEAE